MLLLANPDVDVNLAMPWKLQGATVEATPLFAATFQEESEVVELLMNHPRVDIPRYSQVEHAKGSTDTKEELMEMAI